MATSAGSGSSGVWALLVLAALLGLAIGSFLNVVIHRLPRGLSLSHPPSACPSCGTPIRARHNVPVVGWLVLRGRCHDCGAPISPRYPLVEASTAVLFVLVAARRHGHGHAQLAALPAYLWFTALAVAVALIDVELRRVPLRATGPSALLLTAYLVTVAAVGGHGARLWAALACAAGLALVVAALGPVLRTSATDRAGRVALGWVTGLVLLWAAPAPVVVLAVLAGVVAGVAGSLRTRPAAVGLALCVAGVAGLLL